MLLRVKPKFVHVKTNPSYEEDKDGLNYYVPKGTSCKDVDISIKKVPLWLDHSNLFKHPYILDNIKNITDFEIDNIRKTYKHTNILNRHHGVVFSYPNVLRICGNYYSIEQVYSVYNILKTLLFKGMHSIENTINMLKSVGVEVSIDGFSINFKSNYQQAIFNFKDIQSMREWYGVCTQMFEFEEKKFTP